MKNYILSDFGLKNSMKMIVRNTVSNISLKPHNTNIFIIGENVRTNSRFFNSCRI